MLGSTRRQFFIAVLSALLLLWLAAIVVLAVVVFVMHSIVNGTGHPRHLILYSGTIRSFFESMLHNGPFLILFSLQIMLFLSWLGSLTASTTTPPLLYMLLAIFYAVPGYFGRGQSAFNPLIYFNLQAQDSIRVGLSILWFALSIPLFAFFLRRRLVTYQLAE